MAEDSTRTKMIKDAPTDSPMKDVIKKGMAGVSGLLDRLGLSQEEKYKDKTPQEMEVKKAKGGKVSSASKRADGCAQRGKTRGRMV